MSVGQQVLHIKKRWKYGTLQAWEGVAGKLSGRKGPGGDGQHPADYLKHFSN